MPLKKAWIILSMVIITAGFYWQCGDQQPFYLNHLDSVRYVGMEACAPCHQDKISTFQLTGMGKSFDLATRMKSSAQFGNVAPVFDANLNFWYFPYWRNDTLIIREFRMEGKDTIYAQDRPIRYIIGSGHHTNSHLWEHNGYIYQAPLTFYTQAQRWDLPPGYEQGANTRFDREIGHECMSCHNSLPGIVEGSVNQFTDVPHGISCERCHGPGSIHVQEKKSGKFTPIKNGEPDRTIVNPGKLSPELQADVCQRCHLQGNAVLHPGKKWDSFRPGMTLNEVMDIYMPKYGNDRSKFIMASHAQRLQMSECYIQSNKKLTCITCHNPHVSVQVTGKEIFNTACQKCHTGDVCKEKPEVREKNKNGCWGCHMQKNGTTDIPHVSVTDHMIRRKPMSPSKVQDVFNGIAAINNPNPSALSLSQAWLNAFEQFKNTHFTLDSAEKYIQNLKGEDARKQKIRLYFLREDDQKVVALAGSVNDEKDALTAGRIGNSYLNLQTFPDAVTWLAKAVELAPAHLELKIKLGVALAGLSKKKEALHQFNEVIKRNPYHTLAHFNLGMIYMQLNDVHLALNSFYKCLQLNPDHSGALINAGDILIKMGQTNKGIGYLKRYLKLHPEDSRIKTYINSIH